MNALSGGVRIVVWANVGDHYRQRTTGWQKVGTISELLSITCLDGPVFHDGITLVSHDPGRQWTNVPTVWLLSVVPASNVSCYV